MISLIVARNKNKVIGKDGGIPWHCSSDLKNFKELTTGKIVLMGRKTFESLKCKPLKNRLNIVITSDDKKFNYEDFPNCLFFQSISKAIEVLNGVSYFVIGGSGIYKHFMENRLVDKIYISEIDNDLEGDVFFDFDIEEMNYKRTQSVWGNGNEGYELHVYEKYIKK